MSVCLSAVQKSEGFGGREEGTRGSGGDASVSAQGEER